MSDYRELVKGQAKKFHQENWPVYLADAEEHGGKSPRPNFSKWIDRTTRLNRVIEDQVAQWTHKDYLWVQHNSRNWDPTGGDPRSNAYGSFYRDVLHELKKLSKQV
ncbi:MAG TPA: hypothetical protein VFV36_10980 [Candidatus Methylomirabilis sp.]|nr:hypothetical protein [Candidatus Methylomirabilis sp.]